MAFSFSRVRFQLECLLLSDASLTTFFHVYLESLQFTNPENILFICILFAKEQKQSSNVAFLPFGLPFPFPIFPAPEP